MPKQYEAIKTSMMKRGMPEKMAKMHAAKIYNASHPGNPLKPESHKKRKEPKEEK